MEETGLCLFLPRRQYSSSIAPSFVEAVAGQRNTAPDSSQIVLAEELLVRLEKADVAVRLNLLGQPGEQPDFVVAAWVLPYVYALRGDRDWRRSPQLTGSRQVSPLAVQAYKLLESGEATIPQLKHTLGREVTEGAVLRAITELWQQLRIIPVIQAPGQSAQWQLLRLRFQKAIAEGASTSQVTAISVLASIYLQAVIAASMEEVELFLAPLTARSKIREVLRGLVATRQVHTISLGHAPHFYVAGTLPEFGVPATIYASAALQASSYFLRSFDHPDEAHEPAKPAAAPSLSSTMPLALPPELPSGPPELHGAESSKPRIPATRASSPAAKTPAPHRSRSVTHSRDRKQAQSSSNGHVARRNSESRSSSPRPANGARAKNTARAANGARPANGTRWKSAPKSNGTRTGSHSSTSSSRSVHSNGNGTHRNGSGSARSAKPAASVRGKHSAGKPVVKTSATSAGRKPALTAGTKAGNSKRFGYSVRSSRGTNQGTKKRG
jgi:hypothetical protein